MELVQVNLFYPLIFLSIIVLIITIGIVIIKCKDSDLFNNIFNKSSDNAKEITIDTTSKMKDMHDKTISIPYTDKQEKELHSLETSVKELQENVQDLNNKVDLLVERVIILEKKN